MNCKQNHVFRIYRIVNTVTGMCYIGCTSQELKKRYSAHWTVSRSNKTGCPKLHEAMRAYGPRAFFIEELMETNCAALASFSENSFVTQYNTIDGGYNIYTGGRTHVPPKRTREKIVEKLKAHYQKVPGTFTGRKHSAESCQKIRMKAIGRIASLELREKRRQRMLKFNVLKGKIPVMSVPVICTTVKGASVFFPTMLHASKGMSVGTYVIRRSCDGYPVRKKTYTWDFTGSPGWSPDRFFIAQHTA